MADAMYLTCPHITKNILTYSLERIGDVENSSCTFACMSCDSVFPSLRSLKGHYLTKGHEIFVRIGDRPNLYCGACNDFQFCSYFDNIIGRKRTLSSGQLLSKFQCLPSGGLAVPPSNENNGGRQLTPGLVNMGSTCFMNSVLQVLAHCREFSNSSHFRCHATNCKHLRRTEGDTLPSQPLTACVPCEFYKVAETLSGESATESFVIPSQLLYAIWSIVDYMAGYTQQDAHEFLIAFLNSLGAQLQSIEDSSQNNFQKMFTGVVQSQLVCTVCGNTSSTNESFVDISLTVERYKDGSVVASLVPNDDAMNLLESIDHFTATEILHEKINCETCGIDQQRTKRLRFLETPSLLVLHFKRFDFFRQQKVSRKIIFPMRDLDLTPFQLTNGNGKESLYQLIGVVSHHGTLHQGHYISYTYDRKLCAWMKCDDENVTVVDESEVLDAEAYLLFYQRQSE